jgi:hypothetical protein
VSHIVYQPLALSGSGDLVAVDAIAGKRIAILALVALISAASNIVFKSAATPLTGTMSMAAKGSIVLDPAAHGLPWYITEPGEAFVIASSVAAQIAGLGGLRDPMSNIDNPSEGGAGGPHAASHENGGADEIDVAGLSGELADPQPPKVHDHDADYAPIAEGVTNGDSHDHAGGDGAQIAYSGLSGLPTIPAPANAGEVADCSTVAEQDGSSPRYAKADHVHKYIDQVGGGGSDPTLPTTARTLIDDFGSGSTETGEVGTLGWTFTNGSIVAPAAAVQNHPGLVTRRSGTTAAQVASLHLNATVALQDHRFDELDTFYFVGALVTTGSDFPARFGLGGPDASANPPTHGVYFERLSGDVGFFGVVRNGGAQTRTAQMLAQDTAFHTFRIRRISATQVGFQVDGGGETVISADANIPDAADAVKVFHQIIPTTTTARDHTIDFVSEKLLAVAR